MEFYENDVLEYERINRHKPGPKQYKRNYYKYSKLRKCAFCGKVGAKPRVIWIQFDFALHKFDWDNCVRGPFCKKCRGLLWQIKNKTEFYVEINKLKIRLEKEIKIRLKNGF